jgi:hypothetical protein
VNRTQARAKVDELLGWQRAELIEGRCPKCEALAEDMGKASDQWLERHREGLELPEDKRGVTAQQFIHADDCPLVSVAKDLVMLSNRFGIRLEAYFEYVPRLGNQVRFLRRKP